MTKAKKSPLSPLPSTNSLPRWDLTDLYAGPDDKKLKADLARVEKICAAFQKNYLGKIAKATAPRLAAAITEYEALQELTGKLGGYSYLYYCLNVTDPLRGQFLQSVSEALNNAGTKLVFFTLEINQITPPAYKTLLKNKAVAHYKPWLDSVRDYRNHMLPRDLEEKLHEKDVAGRSAWIRLFDEYEAGLRFDVDGKEMAISEVLNLRSHKDEAMRKKASDALGETLGKNIATFSLISNTLAKDKAIEDKWRKYPSPEASRHLSNQVDQKTVDALANSVRAAYPKLSHRYYALKAKWLGKKQLDYWNVVAPLPSDTDRHYSWTEAQELVLSAYNDFSPKLAAVGKKFFGGGWIDVPPQPGKVSGAFAHPVVPSAHPYLLVNFHGKVRDVMTLAHELGHGVHQVLAGKQGALMCDTPLTLAETASVFGEMLTFQKLLASAPDKKTRKIMLAGKVEDMLNTVVRQIGFYNFEKELHARRAEKELTPEEIGDIWMKVQTEVCGPALAFGKNSRYYWAYISHFIHSPFYVYAYAFGDCLVNALYGVYQEQKTPATRAAFAEKYLTMLSAGGTLRHKELLKPFGLDASKPYFWNKGLNVIAGMIDELETL
jgi:oligoendopeptidase F